MSEFPEARFLVLNAKQSLEVPVRERITIGRGPTNDLVLLDEEISRSHAIIYRLEDGEHAGKLAVKDLNSLNGIFLNGKRLREGVLSNGDELIMGATILLLAPGADKDIEECLSARGKQILKRIGSPRPFVPAAVEAMSLRALADMAAKQLREGTSTAFFSRFDMRTVLTALAQMANETREEEFFRVLLETVRGLTWADRGVVMIREPGEEALTIRALLTDQEDQTIFISQGIIRAAIQANKAVFSLDVAADARFSDLGAKQPSQKPRSLLAVPLEGAEGPVGFLYLDAFRPEVSLDQDCLMLLALFLQPVAQFPMLRAKRK